MTKPVQRKKPVRKAAPVHKKKPVQKKPHPAGLSAPPVGGGLTGSGGGLTPSSGAGKGAGASRGGAVETSATAHHAHNGASSRHQSLRGSASPQANAVSHPPGIGTETEPSRRHVLTGVLVGSVAPGASSGGAYPDAPGREKAGAPPARARDAMPFTVPAVVIAGLLLVALVGGGLGREIRAGRRPRTRRQLGRRSQAQG